MECETCLTNPIVNKLLFWFTHCFVFRPKVIMKYGILNVFNKANSKQTAAFVYSLLCI